MLANEPPQPGQVGRLGNDVHLPGAFLSEVLGLIERELTVWRDRPERKRQSAETNLTSQLCAHMNSVTRRAAGWDILQFRVEEPDEAVGGRKVDLVVSPADTTIWVDGRKYDDFDPLVPIECKRLPTPSMAGRDDREYVFSKNSTTGGIQRFKLGFHGAVHEIAGMIGFVQRDSCAIWRERVGEWINQLVAAGEEGWSVADALTLVQSDTAKRVACLESSHSRKGGLSNITLRHLWIEMS